MNPIYFSISADTLRSMVNHEIAEFFGLEPMYMHLMRDGSLADHIDTKNALDNAALAERGIVPLGPEEKTPTCR